MKFIVDYQDNKRIFGTDNDYDKPNAYYIRRMLNEDIIDIVLDKDKEEVTIQYTNDFVVEIKDERVLSRLNNENDRYFLELKNKIIRFVQEHRGTERLDPEKLKPVNRNRNKQMPKKVAVFIASLGLAATVLLTAGIRQSKREEEQTQANTDPETIISQVLEGTQKPNFDFLIEPDATINIECEDRTATGKYQETESYYGDIIKYYSARYGLPYELVCAQITQERPAIVDGKCDNPCQIDYSLHVGRQMKVPVYNESGFTGEYDEFLVTKEMLDTVDGSIMFCAGEDRNNVDKCASLPTGFFSYNQGKYALKNACDVYGYDISDYEGDEKSIAAVNLINEYYEVHFGSHGDKDYLEHVFSYLPFEDRTDGDGKEIILQYYLGSDLKTIEVRNTYQPEVKR